MKAVKRIGLLFVILSAAAVAWADRPMGKVSVDVPAVIQQAVQREVGDGRVLGLSSDQDQDSKKPIYVVHAQIDGWAYTIRFDLDGTLIDNECDEPDPDAQDITMDDLPPAVRDKMKFESGGAALTDPTRQDIPSVFEVETRIGLHAYTIRVDSDGHLLSKERDDDNDNEPKKST
jgi:hypothetical protein